VDGFPDERTATRRKYHVDAGAGRFSEPMRRIDGLFTKKTGFATLGSRSGAGADRLLRSRTGAGAAS